MPSDQHVPTPPTVPLAPGSVLLSRIAILSDRTRALDHLVVETLRPLAVPSLRILLGLLFVWFGGLKVAGVSPVTAMVVGTIPWFDPNLVVPVLGGVEIILGVGLVTGVGLRLALPVLAAHLAGTFLTFVMLPNLMFRSSNPFLLTEDGEFVTKNLILISAAVVLIVHYRGDKTSLPTNGPVSGASATGPPTRSHS